MKKYFLLLIIAAALGSMETKAQAPPDSVLKKYNIAKEFNNKVSIISDYLNSLTNIDSILFKNSLNAHDYFQKQNDDAGVNIMQLIIGKQLHWKDDYNTSLHYFLRALSGFKARNDTTAIVYANYLISFVYGSARNGLYGVKYLADNLQLARAKDDKKGELEACNAIGAAYGEAFIPDSGLVYAMQALHIGFELKNDTIAIMPLATVAENYIAKGDYDLGISYLRKAWQYHVKINFADISFNPEWFYNDFAQAYLGMKQYDSTIYYAHKSLSYSIPLNDLVQELRSYEYLYKSFDALSKQDSSYKYFRQVTALKDSISSTDKVKAIEATNFREALQQQELETQKRKMEEERQQNIQYALIALGIISLLIFFFLLSHSIIFTEKWVSFFGILGLLIVFEFINLLIHPFIESVTHHSPILMLLALVATASLLIPMHHKIEKWTKNKMTENNKKRRLKHAKKTIQNLKGNSIKPAEESD